MRANKVSLNTRKTELVLFTSPKTQPDSELKIKFKFYETDSVEYLGLQIEKNLTWTHQINHVAIKLKKANSILSKLRHALDNKTVVSLLCNF